MGCALLFLAGSMMGGFLLLVSVLPTLIRYPWIILVGALLWLAYYFFKRYTRSEESKIHRSNLCSPMPDGSDWIRATYREKLDYIRSACWDKEREEGRRADPNKIIAGIDQFFNDPANHRMLIAYAFGFNFVGAELPRTTIIQQDANGEEMPKPRQPSD
jgi:hypothetical protein